MASAWPIIVVTGANGGIGFGICQRLLYQLSQAHPPDGELHFRSVLDSAKIEKLEIEPCDGLTLVMACRSQKRAEAARQDLYTRLDRELKRRRREHGPDAHAERFRANLRIEFQYIDLAVVSTVFKAATELSQKYPYISHLICNAGLASFSGINWFKAIVQLLSGWVLAVTVPRFNNSNVGERSVDGLGWVWQCNVFSHFALFRSIEPLLAASGKTKLGPGRVIWMTSVESSPEDYDPEDWQLVKTKENYALSKFQTDLIATRLDMLAVKQNKLVRHVLVQPGVAATSIAATSLNWFTARAMVLAFWLARWLGSPHHTINREHAALAFVHISLVPLFVIDLYRAAFSSSKTASHFAKSHVPVRDQKHKLMSFREGVRPKPDAMRPARFGSEVDFFGHERIGITEIREWDVFEEESGRLLEKFDGLLKEVREAEMKPKDIEGFKGMSGHTNEKAN